MYSFDVAVKRGNKSKEGGKRGFCTSRTGDFVAKALAHRLLIDRGWRKEVRNSERKGWYHNRLTEVKPLAFDIPQSKERRLQ